MRILLTTFNSSYIHKNLALRWLYVARPEGHHVEIKEYTIKDSVDVVVNYIVENNFDVVGISTYIWNVAETKQLITQVREVLPNIKIVLGGPEVTYENDEWFEFAIDGIILGEGEQVFWDYVIDNKTDYVKVQANEFKPIRKENVEYLESLPSPYNLDIDKEDFSNQYLYVEASRGCPFKCSYCLSSLDNNVRFFSLDYLENLFESVKHYPINQVKFLDRTFNAHKHRTKSLYAMLEKYDNIESFQVEIVADRLDDDLIDMIIQPQNRHRYRYEIGIQSYNAKTLESVDRRQDNDRLNAVMKKLLEYDVVLHADLIAGLPYENLESFQASFNELANVYPTELQLGILKLLKGTKMKREALDLGFLYNKDAPYEVYKTPWLIKDEMNYINIVAKGVDRTLNRSLLETTVKYLNDKVYKGDLFSLYYKIGEIFEQLGIGYQKHQLFMLIYEKFKGEIDENILKSVLTIDYLKGSRQKSKLLFSESNLKEVNRRIVDNNYFSQNEVYRYSRVYKDYRYEDTYIMALYNSDQNACTMYHIDFKEEVCQEI